MNIPVHHDNDRQTYAYFSSCHHHNEENKKLPVYPGACIFSGIRQVMHDPGRQGLKQLRPEGEDPDLEGVGIGR